MKKTTKFLVVAFLMLVLILSIKAPIQTTLLKALNYKVARTTPTLNKPLAIVGAVNAYKGAGILIATTVVMI